ncbi:MAG: hypothetical protein ACI4KG_08705 [Oscillospiraceae bacterium]
MGKFRLQIDVEPKDIPSLDDSHKRDCADSINGVINHTFKYTLFLSLGVMAFFGAYSLFGFTYLMRMEKVLPQLSVVMPLICLAIFLLEFISGAMHKWAIITEILLHAALIFTVMMKLQTVWIIPFAIYGVVVHLKLLTLTPLYKVLSEQKGFPEFTSLPTKDEITVKNNKAQ